MGYFQYRLRELIVWLGIPFLGAVAGESFSLGFRLVLFGGSMVFAMAHVLLINDWGDLKKNPYEKERFVSVFDVELFRSWLLIFAMLSITASVCLYAQLVPVWSVGFLAVTGVVLSLLYSHPKIHLKESIIGATILHFLGGILQFMLGYVVFSQEWYKGILLGVFFSLIFVAGHLVHECIDVQQDKKGGIQTRATRFGVRTVLQAAIMFFLLAHFFLLIIATMKMINLMVFFIFLLPLILHFVFLSLLWAHLEFNNNDIKKYRTYYRLAYAGCSFLFVLLIISNLRIL